MIKKLSLKEKLFCKILKRTKDPVQAVFQSGVKQCATNERAKDIADILLEDEAIKEELFKIEFKSRIQFQKEKTKIIDEWRAIAFANITDAIDISGGVVRFKDTQDLSASTKKAILEVSSGPKGSSLKMHDKLKALEKFGFFYGIDFSDILAREIEDKIDSMKPETNTELEGFKFLENQNGIDKI